MRASASDRWQAMKRGDTGLMAVPAAVAPLDEILVAEQRDGRQGTAAALGCVLDGDAEPCHDHLAAHPVRLARPPVAAAIVAFPVIPSSSTEVLASNRLPFEREQNLLSICRRDAPMQEKSAARTLAPAPPEPRRRRSAAGGRLAAGRSEAARWAA